MCDVTHSRHMRRDVIYSVNTLTILHSFALLATQIYILKHLSFTFKTQWKSSIKKIHFPTTQQTERNIYTLGVHSSNSRKEKSWTDDFFVKMSAIYCVEWTHSTLDLLREDHRSRNTETLIRTNLSSTVYSLYSIIFSTRQGRYVCFNGFTL